MPETTRPASGLIERLLLLPCHTRIRRNDHLCNPITAPDHEILLPEIREDDLDLTAIIGINGAGGVENPHLVFDGKSAAGTNLGLIALGQGDGKTGGEKSRLSRFQDEFAVDGSTKVHTRRMVGGIRRQRKVAFGAVHVSDSNDDVWGQRRFGVT